MMHDPLKFVRLFVDHCFGAALCLNGKEREGGPAFKSPAPWTCDQARTRVVNATPCQQVFDEISER